MLRALDRDHRQPGGGAKGMVDAFSEYARTPEPTLQAVDLNALMREVLACTNRSASSIAAELARGSAGCHRRRRRSCGRSSTTCCRTRRTRWPGAPQPRITIRTERGDGAAVRVSITDNGAGFPEALMKRAFEPYVTTKPKGTGWGSPS